MSKLHILENTELSAYCLNILEKHNITLIREFVAEKSYKLVKILNLNCEQVQKIKEELLRLYGPKRNIATERFKTPVTCYGTHIDNLDQMLAPRDLLSNHSFWEICGPSGVGKTQLALSLVLNFVTKQMKSVLYIDTKLDFSASRIKNMLEARKIEPELYAGIMSYIKVERVLSAQGVVEMLEEFYKQLKQENKDITPIKMIVIDSLPAVWFLLNTDSNYLSSKRLLSRLNQIINRIVHEYFVAVICINLSLIPSTKENKPKGNKQLFTHINLLIKTKHSKAASINTYNNNDITDIIEYDDMGMDGKKSPYRPALGKFWLSKPYVRLSLEFPDKKSNLKCEEDSTIRVINLVATRYSPRGLSCLIQMQPEGFV